MAKAAARAQRRVVGDPFEEGVEQGPQVDQDQLNKILAYIDVGQREGARMLCGGKRRGDAGYFVSGWLLAGGGSGCGLAGSGSRISSACPARPASLHAGAMGSRDPTCPAPAGGAHRVCRRDGPDEDRAGAGLPLPLLPLLGRSSSGLRPLAERQGCNFKHGTA